MAIDPTVKVKQDSIKLRRKPIQNGVILYSTAGKSIGKTNYDLKLPIYGYKSLLNQYTISINGKKIAKGKYSVSSGWLSLKDVKENNIKNVKVQFNNPKIYSFTLYFSIFVLFVLIIILGSMKGIFENEKAL